MFRNFDKLFFFLKKKKKKKKKKIKKKISKNYVILKNIFKKK